MGTTPLHWAVSSRFSSKVLTNLATLYLDHGAKLDREDYNGVTPLLYAAENGKLPMIKLLAASASQADMQHKDHDGNTALFFAASNFNHDVCGYFIDKGFDCNAVNSHGSTPLHFACSRHLYDNIFFLLEAGAKVNVKDLEGRTPLDILKKHSYDYDPSYKECAKILEKLEMIAKSDELNQNLIQSNSDLPSSISLKSGSFTTLVDRQILSAKAPYFKKLFNQLDQAKSTVDLTEEFDEHLFRCMIMILNDKETVVKSFEAAIALLIVGDEIQAPEITAAALQYIQQMDESEFKKLKQSCDKHPIISKLISSIATMLERYPNLKVDEVLPQINPIFLNGDINEHLNNLNQYSEKIAALTHLTWQFNGANYKSEDAYDWYPDDPKHLKKYANVATNLLIARGMLSGNNEERNQWVCKITNVDELLKLDAKKLQDDIETASDLIAKITGAPCNFLDIYPVKDAAYYEVLEKIGCIKVKEYFAFNAQVIDFDLPKLRKLQDEKISMQEIWSLYNKADHAKPLFEQICKNKASMHLSKVYNSAHALLFGQSSHDNTEIKKASETHWVSPAFERKR